MNKQIVLVFLFFSSFVFAQKNWFKLYTDKGALAKDGVEVGNQFIADAQKLIPNLKDNPQIIVNTTPFLVYYDGKEKTVNLPFWDEVIPQNQEYFEKITGNAKDGKRLFWLMFNGFYLPHELGHWLSFEKSGNIGSYQDEYLANTIAILWWKKQGKSKELKSIYNDRVEKKILEKIEYKKNQDVFQDDFKEDNKTDKIKKLYRQIVKITHPDKIVDSILNKMYLAANDYYDSNDILGIYKICDQLSIEYEIDTNDIDLIKDQISVMKDRISFIESTLAWKWYSEENINKNELLINYIRSQII